MNSQEFIKFKADTERQLLILKRRNTFLTTILLVGIIFATITSFKTNNEGKFNSIRTKEIIVEDAMGLDRIVISSCISSTKNRIRKDTLNGVLVLDAKGNDRVILGESPTVNINGKIIKRATNGPYGVAFNDEFGAERGGLGYYADKGLSALGLDGPSGEGIVLFVPKKELFGQKAGIIINDPQAGGQMMYIGATTKGDRMINMDVQGKGRFSIEMDSTSATNINHYDYKSGANKTLLKSK